MSGCGNCFDIKMIRWGAGRLIRGAVKGGGVGALLSFQSAYIKYPCSLLDDPGLSLISLLLLGPFMPVSAFTLCLYYAATL